jgi:hypothetical protein
VRPVATSISSPGLSGSGIVVVIARHRVEFRTGLNAYAAPIASSGFGVLSVSDSLYLNGPIGVQ